MNAEQLLQHYERIADAPDAVARLRQLILALAVRGKLCRSNAGRTTAAAAGSPAPENVPFDIPVNWSWRRLRELGRIRGGGTPSKARDDFWNGTIPWVSPKDMKVDYIDTAQMKITDAALAGSAANLIAPQSVLFVVRGMILAHSFPVAVTTATVTINQDMKAIELRESKHAEYLLRALRGLKPEMLERVQRSSHGTCRLEGDDYADFLVPIPPLAEQRRIVAKVDELMALCDRLEAARSERETTRDRMSAASLARLNEPDPDPALFARDARFTLDNLAALTTRPDQIKQLRQTILNLAVRGKLVPQDPKDEPASELLKRIAVDKAARAVSARDRRAIKIRPLSVAEMPFPLPSNWVGASCGDITISRDGERIPVSREEREQKAKVYDYYGASGVIDKIDGFLFDKPLLLIGEDGANLINRSTPIAFIARGKYWVNNHAHVLDGLSEEFLRYLELFINAIDLKPYVTGTAQPKMNQAKMNGIPVALPPLAEQHRIVAKVDQLLALCDRLEASLADGATTRRRLLDALLADALAPAALRDGEAVAAE